MTDVAIPEEIARAVFDVAVGSSEFDEGCLDEEEVRALRAFASLIGVDPGVATPVNHHARWEEESAALARRHAVARQVSDEIVKWAEENVIGVQLTSELAQVVRTEIRTRIAGRMDVDIERVSLIGFRWDGSHFIWDGFRMAAA